VPFKKTGAFVFDAKPDVRYFTKMTEKYATSAESNVWSQVSEQQDKDTELYIEFR
jgi:hypothetical protein